MFNFFGQPWTLLGAAVLVLFGVLTFRSIFPEKRRSWQLMLPVLVAVGSFGLDLLVQTDPERIEKVIDRGITGVEEENCNAIAQIISDNYRDSYHNTKIELMSHCRAKLSQPLVEKNRKMGWQIEEISPPNATVILTLITHFDKQSDIYKEFLKPFMMTKTRLYLQKQRNKRWLINRVELLELDKQRANWQDFR
jgi:hypothetical protein